MRLGVFGGSFNPVHYGHLLLAETCREALELNQLWFVPAAIAPHKQDQQTASADARIAMLELAIGGHPDLSVSKIEVDRGGVSYTIDTLREIRGQLSEVDIFLLMGADSLHDLPSWREPKAICTESTPVVVVRGGSPTPNFSVLDDVVGKSRRIEIESSAVELPAIELSSTEIRQRTSTGKSIRFRTPRAVESYIEAQQLYRD